MDETPQLIDGFKSKFYKLVANYKQLGLENGQLIKENEKLKSELDYKTKQIEDLDGVKKVEELKDAFLTSDGDVKKAKQNISRIVREIDNCIALLNR